LEVSIIRATKINKVLKAILKLDKIPKEEDLQFKPRSQTLLDKWNKILATDPTANGVNGNPKTDKEATNGVKEPEGEAKPTSESDKDATKTEASAPGEKKSSEAKTEPKAEAASEEKPAAEEVCPPVRGL
jgi:hypothetical protein